MREITIGKNDAGQRLDRFVSKSLPLLPPALLQKYIRLKRIKCNGARAQRDQRLQEGDVLQLYINDEFFDKPREDNLFLTLFKPSLDIVYEDENLLLLNKRPGLVVHADETEKVNTLINHIQAYLYQKRAWNPRWENAFTPALCNRIDRNTGGIVIAAKDAEALRDMNRLIREDQLSKFYLCLCHGSMERPAATLHGYLAKDSARNLVRVEDHPFPGAREIITKYRVLDTRGKGADAVSLLQVELSRDARIRYARTSRTSGTPCWGTASTASTAPTGRKASSTRHCTHVGWILISPATGGVLPTCAGAPSA